MIEHITHHNKIIAIIVRGAFSKPGIFFCTPGSFPEQLGFINYPAGKIIQAHTHNIVVREVALTQEVLILKKGRMRVDFYDEFANYLESRIVKSGDIVFLASGGHGFEVLEEIDMIEVKQGPYMEEEDKIRFSGVKPEDVIFGRDEA